MADVVDIGLPFRQGTEGFPQPVTGDETVKDSIIQILLTEIGERVFQPDFGSDLRRFLFESDTPAIRTAIAGEVLRAVTAWEPKATDLSVGINFEESTVTIDIFYVNTMTGAREAVELSFPRL